MPETVALSANRESPHWQLAGSEATDTASQAQLRLDNPAGGLAVGDLQLLGLALPVGCGPVEAWARGVDLTAIYEPGDERGLRITSMWRTGCADAAVGVRSWQLILSAQTSLLSSPAELRVVSQIDGNTTLGCWRGGGIDWESASDSAATCLRVRRAAAEPEASCLVLAIHPDDAGVVELTADPAGIQQICCRLFPSDLEKGVLLRSRVLAAIGPAESAEGWTASVLERFASSEPVLTA